MSRMAASIECHPHAGNNDPIVPPASGRLARTSSRLAAAASMIALLTTAFACSPGGAPAPEDSRPNVVLITIDSLRADHLGYAGAARAATPNIDALAARSVRFTDAQTPSPLSLPATASLLTGRYPSSTGVRSEERNALPADETTLAEALKGAGYRSTAVVGSILLHPKFGLDQGFDDYMLSFGETPRPRNTPVVGFPAARVVDKALDWLEGAYRDRFFMWVNFHDPHYFYSPPPPYDTDFADAPYDGEVAYVDSQIGRLLDRLKSYGVDDDTIILLAGNHGEGLADHGEAYHGTLLYQSTLHVPVLVKPAGTPGAGRDDPTPISLVDLMPTVLELAGVSAGGSMDGRSVAAALSASGGGIDAERPLFAETTLPRDAFGWRPMAAVRSGRWKYIASEPARLFDLQADPAESVDLAASQPDVTAKLSELVAARISFTLPECAPCAEQARALGFGWPGEVGPMGRDIDPESRIDLANDVLKAHRSLQRHMAQAGELIYRDVLRRDPDNRLALIDVALLRVNAQDLKTAREMFAHAQRLYADEAEVYHVLGHLALVAPADQERSTALFRLSVALDPLNEEALYDAACGVALQGDKETAIDLLQKSVAAGFRDFRHMRRDTDIDSLRDDPRFAEIVPQAEKPAEANPYGGPMTGQSTEQPQGQGGQQQP